ncbi:MAG: hypothetical protein HONBIEJF_00199 [Fimbriimonadaceae bacterium]|nr:hypothetical protein [Fimbriimonadaceae bacterium]
MVFLRRGWVFGIPERELYNGRMANFMTRRSVLSLGVGVAVSPLLALGQEKQGPREATFIRDYPEPDFRPSWKNPQISRQMVQDFVIYAHSNLEMTQKLLDREPMLINGVVDWGAGDWESGLGGASHMGRHDIVAALLARGARMDIFCATMMGQLEVVKALLKLEPKLIDARGPHGFNLHFHAQLAGKNADDMVAFLQSVKKIELKPNPFIKK